MENGSGNKKGLWIWLALGVLLMVLYNSQQSGRNDAASGPVMEYSEFMKKLNAGQIASITLENDDKTGKGMTRDNMSFVVHLPKDPWLTTDLLKNDVRVKSTPPKEQSLMATLLISWLPILLLIGVWIWFAKQQAGGGKGGNPFSFGKSKARLMDMDKNPITFKDVAGCDEAKQEVGEIVDFLRDPTKFQKLGGRVPKGVLMVGPPGTGKTLLAKAVAGEAKVPFFSISGSDFVEMFVGVGAARVRDMFEQAKKSAPCIIFIDEIDAVGRQRGAGVGGGNDEREQTLNQILVEMDGFESSLGIIIIGATNRPDVLDPALVRPGRLDRQVVVGLPDIKGREQILAVHAKKVPLAEGVEIKTIARGTPGFSGADLANLVNEAALFAARKNKLFVEMEDFESAKDKIMMGPERKNVVMPVEELKNTAYHEAGHAVVAAMLPKADPVHKVTIIPRGRALGVTMQLPSQDRYSHDKEYLLGQIAMLYGGRLAEELFMGQMTTGASNDFERATKLAKKMVAQWGMSDLGVMVYSEDDHDPFLGRSMGRGSDASEQTRREVDEEVRKILKQQYEKAKKILMDNSDIMHRMAEALLDLETLEAEQVKALMERREIEGYEEKAKAVSERKAKMAEDAKAIEFQADSTSGSDQDDSGRKEAEDEPSGDSESKEESQGQAC